MQIQPGTGKRVGRNSSQEEFGAAEKAKMSMASTERSFALQQAF